jgi:hypothetical protein
VATRLTFNEGNHSYWLKQDDGRQERATSVSALRTTLHTFEGERYHLGLAADVATENWESFAELAPTARREALLSASQTRAAHPREFGKAVHHYCQQLWTGGTVELPSEYQVHVQAAADWWNAQRCSLYATELMCWDEGSDDIVPLAGRFDLMVNHPWHGLGLLDLKTWLAQSSGKPRPDEWGFQLTAYSDMRWLVDTEGNDTPMPKVQWAGVLHVGPSGAALWTLSEVQRRRASLQVEYARALKALPKPMMYRQGEAK